MSTHWSSTTIARLRDATRCPDCTRPLNAGVCGYCQADLRGASGAAVWQAASSAATALSALQAEVARLPRRVASPQPAPAAPSPAIASVDGAATIAPVARASTTLQSVLAVAGAGLMAVAALVFAFLNPDLTDPTARGLLLAIAAVLFAASAPLLMRWSLRVSAECLAALGMIFGALATIVLTPQLAASIDPLGAATMASLLGGAVLLSAGVATRIRGWMLAGSLALTTMPLLAALALGADTVALWGPLGSAAAALVLLHGATRLEARRSLSLRLDRAALVSTQVLAFVALAGIAVTGPLWSSEHWLAMAAAVLGAGAIAARSARFAVRGLWSFGAGASMPAALALAAAALELRAEFSTTGSPVLVSAAAAIGLVLVGLTASSKRRTHRPSVFAGAVTVVAVIAAPLAAGAALGAAGALFGFDRIDAELLQGDWGVSVIASLVIMSAGFAVLGRIVAVRAGRPLQATAALQETALWLIGLAGLGAMGLAVVAPETRAMVGIVVVAATASILTAIPAVRSARIAARAPIVIAVHGGLLIAVSLSWQSVETAVLIAPAALVALAAVARTAAAILRPAHLALGYGYALVIVAAALSVIDVTGAAQLSLTATAGLLGAIAATFIRRISAAHWITVLVVATVPFMMAVALVITERSGWVALSTATMVVLAVSVLVTRRPGLSGVVRVLAGAIIVPSLAVVLVNLGAQLLVTSGSPIVLPAIAVVCALALPIAPRMATALQAHGMPAAHARAVVNAVEVSTLVTATIAVVLAFVREAAGPLTALIVLLVLSAGSAVTAATATLDRRETYWWLTGATATGALWCLWFELGVTSPEAHVLPPTLGAALVAAVLTSRGRPNPRLYGAGLLVAIVPLVGLVAMGADDSPARAIGLVTASVALTALGAVFGAGAGPSTSTSASTSASTGSGAGTPSRPLASLAGATYGAAIAAASAAFAQAARYGLGLDDAPVPSTVEFVVIVALAGAVPAAIAGVLLTRSRRKGRRWALVPAIVGASAAAWTAIEPTEPSVQALYVLMLVLLALMVIATVRERHVDTYLPRAWVLFALALATAIVAWSPREFLRVEAFSLPLGLMLVVAGALAMRHTRAEHPAPLHHWPMGRAGSWPLLAPGIIVLVLASMLATATDPQTWRAVLVMGIALVAILVGVRWRLAAPFVLGMIVLPIENVLAFSVQIGRGIEAMPWWITLAVVGVVLLVIAVGSERRSGDGATPTARLRDLK